MRVFIRMVFLLTCLLLALFALVIAMSPRLVCAEDRYRARAPTCLCSANVQRTHECAQLCGQSGTSPYQYYRQRNQPQNGEYNAGNQ